MKPVIVFDVNETLLNVGALAPHFERVFGDKLALPHALPIWSNELDGSVGIGDCNGLIGPALNEDDAGRLQSILCGDVPRCQCLIPKSVLAI